MVVRIDNRNLKYFAFDIGLPDETCAEFWIYHDLAGLFGYEFNHDAMQALRADLRRTLGSGLRRLTFDPEADGVSIAARSPELILRVAESINRLSLPDHHRRLDEATESELLVALKGWKRPKGREWSPGDVFVLSLSDGSSMYGQILARCTKMPSGFCYCALFDLHASEPVADLHGITRSRVIAILNVRVDSLVKGIWRIIGRANPVADPRVTRFFEKSFFTDRGFAELAEAWAGLSPWRDESGDPSWNDRLLLPGIERRESM